jgi:hypothetical protein
MATKRTTEEVEAFLERYHARGSVTRRAFCETEGVSVSLLGYYLRQRVKPPRVRLARVKVTKEACSRQPLYALILANGRRIECGPAELAHLIDAAERA